MRLVAPIARSIPSCLVALKKLCLTGSLVIVFLFISVTFMYSFRNPWPVRRGIYNPYDAFNGIVNAKQLQFASTRDVTSSTQKQNIKIIILSFPRSGSSFLGDIFNHHPSVFYLYEPLRTVQRRFSEDSLFEFDFSSASYQTTAKEFLKDIVDCNFDSNTFTSYLTLNERDKSLALNSSPFCFQNRTCQELKSPELDDVCRNKYNIFAAKVLSPRIPTSRDWIETFSRSCSTNSASRCKVIHLVRDPRAVAYSLKSVRFFKRRKDPRRDFVWFVKKICRQMEFDLSAFTTARTLLPDGYRLIRFEDLARNPLSMVSELYKFVGIEMLDTIKKWLHETTKAGNARKRAFGTIRDSKKVVASWRTKMSSEKVRVVEKYCRRVMLQLNYTLTGMSPTRQINLNISLID